MIVLHTPLSNHKFSFLTIHEFIMLSHLLQLVQGILSDIILLEFISLLHSVISILHVRAVLI